MYKSDHSQNSMLEKYMYDDSYLAVPMPLEQSLCKEVRFNANYFSANRLS